MSDLQEPSKPAEETPEHWKQKVAHDVVEWMCSVDPVEAMRFGMRAFSLADAIEASVRKHAPRMPGLTKGEHEVLMHLSAAWNAFCKLDHLHPSEVPEMQDAIHTAQYLIGVRVAARANPEMWTPRG